LEKGLEMEKSPEMEQALEKEKALEMEKSPEIEKGLEKEKGLEMEKAPEMEKALEMEKGLEMEKMLISAESNVAGSTHHPSLPASISHADNLELH